ncbi:unnamed protein product, partial [Ixodes persulcatus]
TQWQSQINSRKTSRINPFHSKPEQFGHVTWSRSYAVNVYQSLSPAIPIVVAIGRENAHLAKPIVDRKRITPHSLCIVGSAGDGKRTETTSAFLRPLYWLRRNVALAFTRGETECSLCEQNRRILKVVDPSLIECILV